MPQNRGRTNALVAGGTILVIVLAALYVFFLTYKPAYSSSATANDAVKVTTGPNGQKQATLELNIEQQVGTGPHADWLGYQTLSGHPGTIFHLPANALITVIIHNFDSQTQLRNYFFTGVRGTVGGVAYANGKKFKVMDPNITSHTFTIPDLDVTVPMEGIPASGKPDHIDMKFQFRTHGPAHLRWQCFVPCGSGLYGNGGPMSEIGYMGGIIQVG